MEAVTNKFKKFLNLSAIIILFLCVNFLRIKAEKNFHFANTPLFSKEFSEVAHYQDIWLILLGMRRIAADIAFIQLLQYYGDVPAEELPREKVLELKRKGVLIFGVHRELFKYALRTIRLDRNFEFAVTYTAAALAWVQKRDEEAIKILEDALNFRKTYYQASLYLAAITVRKNKAEKEAIKYLEEAIKFPDAPFLAKVILAEIYKRQKDYKNSLRVWSMLLDIRQEYWRKRAQKEVFELLQKIQNQK